MRLGMELSACGLTSLTTNGTCASMRHAEELSITMAPLAATLGANAREVAAPAENSTMCNPA